MIATNFCPRGYAPAEGQVFQIQNNQALFSLLGTTYGGDGRRTFNLPDLRASVPVGVGQRPGMKQVSQGAQGRLGPGRNRMAAATLGLRYCIAIQGIFPSRN
ncbi:MAG: tail fiber protein [Pseudomonadota bacterium]